MRAEGPKERPTAVLSVQLSTRYVEILRSSGYYVTTFYRILYVRAGVPLSISRYSAVWYASRVSCRW